MNDKPYNAADEKQVRERKRTAKDIQDQQRDDLRRLLDLPEFRRYIWRLIGERCKLLESPGSANGSIQSVNIGRGDVGREIWAEVEATDPLAIPMMMREHHEAMK